MKPIAQSVHTIRFRLTALYAAILAVSLAAAGVYVFYAVQLAAEHTVDKDLRARLLAERDTLPAELKEDGAQHVGADMDEDAAESPAGVWIQLADAQGHWLHRAAAMNNDDPPPAATGLPEKGVARTVEVKDEPVRVLTAPVGEYVVQIGMPMGEFGEMLEDLPWTLALAAPPLLLLACVGGYWLSGRALQPVDDISLTVQTIGSTNLAARLALRGTGDELDRLAATMNGMLARIESAFRLVSQLTADASHELRTPVAIVRTTAEVVRTHQRTTAEHEQAWDQVVVQAERMSSLIDDLLLLARADAGQSDMHFETVDMLEVVAQALSDMHILAKSSGVTLESSVAAGIVRGDAEALRRLLVILLDNAIKYSNAGGTVFLSACADGTNSTSAYVVEVRDSGIGIHPRDLPRIFDRFYRVSKDRSRQSGGSGLGLSIAQWIAGLHGGTIAAESAAGKG